VFHQAAANDCSRQKVPRSFIIDLFMLKLNALFSGSNNLLALMLRPLFEVPLCPYFCYTYQPEAIKDESQRSFGKPSF
jgi:hypothetical protein